MKTEKIQVEYEKDALDQIAEIAAKINMETENIGARRLHTIMEKLMEDISFNAPENPGLIKIDRKYVPAKAQ